MLLGSDAHGDTAGIRSPRHGMPLLNPIFVRNDELLPASASRLVMGPPCIVGLVRRQQDFCLIRRALHGARSWGRLSSHAANQAGSSSLGMGLAIK